MVRRNHSQILQKIVGITNSTLDCNSLLWQHTHYKHLHKCCKCIVVIVHPSFYDCIICFELNMSSFFKIFDMMLNL